MDLHDYRNVRRVLSTVAKDWGCSVRTAKYVLGCCIEKNWEKSRSDLERKALWDQYFPDGKPTPEQYILWMGYAHERGETIPYLFTDERVF